MIPLEGTFEYVATVPASVANGEFVCEARLSEPVDPRHSSETRLVGAAPRLTVTDAGLTPDPGPQRPWVMRSRFSLTPETRHRASVAEAEFHIDRAVMARVRAGDQIYFTRTGCGGLGLSIVRADLLVVAVGAITAVYLGRDMVASVPGDLVAAAAAIFRERDGSFEFVELPLEVQVNGVSMIVYRGGREFGLYGLRVEHGFLPGLPGTDVCAALCRRGACNQTAANMSAQLLDAPAALKLRRG